MFRKNQLGIYLRSPLLSYQYILQKILNKKFRKGRKGKKQGSSSLKFLKVSKAGKIVHDIFHYYYIAQLSSF